MVKRQLPSPRALAQLMKFKKPTLSATRRRLDGAATIYDLRDIAMRRTPKGPFEYADGSAELEISLARARQAFEDIEFHPAILTDVSSVDTGWDVLGSRVEYPFGIAPTGFTRMMQTEGEVAAARAASAAGIPFALSMMGTTKIEGVVEAAPGGRNWFQLYMWKDRDLSAQLIERAAKAGYEALVVTVDVPVGGARHKDKYNGFSIPPSLTAGTILNALPRPAWWLNFLTTEPLGFAAMDEFEGTMAQHMARMFDPSVGYDDLRWVKEQWPGKFIVKGVQTVADARKLADFGVDAITLSNHGGRQLDRAPVPFHLLPEVVREVGNDVEIHLDTGIMSGSDIVASVALGARYTMIGRAYLYGLMAGGQRGVEKAISILGEGVARTMALLGVQRLDELEPGHVTQLRRLV